MQEDMAELVEALAAAGKAKFYDGLCRTYMASPDKVRYRVHSAKQR